MSKPNGMRSLTEALDFLSALNAQLMDSPDLSSMKMDKYGPLVPVYLGPKGMTEQQRLRLVQRLDAESKKRAKAISDAAEVVRELLRSLSRSDKVPIKDLTIPDADD
jgi:hypothetical protein